MGRVAVDTRGTAQCASPSQCLEFSLKVMGHISVTISGSPLTLQHDLAQHWLPANPKHTGSILVNPCGGYAIAIQALLWGISAYVIFLNSLEIYVDKMTSSGQLQYLEVNDVSVVTRCCGLLDSQACVI